MKLYLSVIIMLLLVTGCNQKPGTTEKPADTKVADQKTISIKLAEFASPKDLYCGMPLEEGSIADTTMYDGKLYGFCSTECKTEFLKDPQGHLTQK